jgi:hypothetical protein
MAARGAESRARRGEAAIVAAFCRRGRAGQHGGDGGAGRQRSVFCQRNSLCRVLDRGHSVKIFLIKI